MTDIKKALTLRASSIGDGLMGKYLLENIHAAYPGAQCSLLVSGKSAMIRDLLAAYPWIHIIEANTRRPGAIISAFQKLFPSDATVTQYSGRGMFSSSSKLFSRILTRPGRLAGFTDTWPLNRLIFDHLIPFSTRRAMRLYECDALAALDVPIQRNEITLVPLPGNPILEKLGLAKGAYIVLNLFSGSAKRGLTLQHQQNIAQALQKEVGVRIVLTGGLSDEPLMQEIKKTIPAALVAPALSMQELITLVKESKVTISLDTGVGHIAAQTGVPVVIMRTCWGYQWWTRDQYPRKGITVLAHDELCTSGHISKNFPECLGTISPEEVVDAIKKLPNE